MKRIFFLLFVILVCLNNNIHWVAAYQPELKNSENMFIMHSDNPKVIAQFGEALFNNKYGLDAVVYLKKAAQLGYKSKCLDDAVKKATKGITTLKPVKLTDGEHPSISPNGRCLAYVSINDFNKELQFNLMIMDLQTKEQKKICKLTEGRVIFHWSHDNKMIAFIEEQSLVVVNIENGEIWSRQFNGLPMEDSIVWSCNDDKLGFVTQKSGVFRITLLDVHSKELTMLCNGKSILSFNSEGLLINQNGKIIQVKSDGKWVKNIGSIPGNIQVRNWAKRYQIGVGFSLESESIKDYGNDPMVTDLKTTKIIKNFPYCRCWETRINGQGNIIAFTEATELRNDIYTVIWLVTVDGKHFAPIDSGDIIDITPDAFSEDGLFFVYSKGNQSIYLVSLKFE